MNKFFVCVIALLVVACGKTTRNPHESLMIPDPGMVYGDDPMLDEPDAPDVPEQIPMAGQGGESPGEETNIGGVGGAPTPQEPEEVVLRGSLKSPYSKIIIPDVLQELVRYDLSNETGQSVQVSRVTLENVNGNLADFSALSVGWTDGKDVMPEGVMAEPYVVDLSALSLMVPAHRTVTLVISGIPRHPVSTYEEPGLNLDIPRSGDIPSMRLTGIDLMPGQGTVVIESNVGAYHTLRRSAPVFTVNAPETATFSSGEQAQLYAFRLDRKADDLRWKQIAFDIEVLEGNVSFRDLAFYRGESRIASNEVSIFDEDGVDLTDAVVTGNLRVYIRLTVEHGIDDSGTEYSFRAIPTFSGKDATVETRPSRSNATCTGYLGTNGNDSLGLAFERDDVVDCPGYFLWSDISESPHSDQLSGGSMDWTNDTHVEDMYSSVVLKAAP